VRRRHAALGGGEPRDGHHKRTDQQRGEFCFRGTMGIDREVPVGLHAISLRLGLDTDADPEQIITLMALTKGNGVVYQTLARGV
jgi:hypothetical protein